MTARRSVLLQFLALLAAVGMSLACVPSLRYSVPTWWDYGARPEGASSGDPVMLWGPLLLAGVLGSTFAVLRGRSLPPAGIFGALAVASGLFLGEHAALLGVTLFKGIFVVRLALAMGFGLLFGIAPVMARVEPNPWFGVRTPWTLGSRRVWKATHRATGRLWLVGGAVGSALTMFGAPFGLMVALLVGLVLAPAPIGYAVWRRMGRP